MLETMNGIWDAQILLAFQRGIGEKESVNLLSVLLFFVMGIGLSATLDFASSTIQLITVSSILQLQNKLSVKICRKKIPVPSHLIINVQILTIKDRVSRKTKAKNWILSFCAVFMAPYVNIFSSFSPNFSRCICCIPCSKSSSPPPWCPSSPFSPSMLPVSFF